MRKFTVTIRTERHCNTFTVIAATSMAAYTTASEANGNTVCSITVTPARAK